MKTCVQSNLSWTSLELKREEVRKETVANFPGGGSDGTLFS